MKLLFPAFVSALLLLNTSTTLSADGAKFNCKNHLQANVDSLKIGVSTIDDLEKLLGKPEKLNKGVEWHAIVYNNIRTMYHAEYPSKGLSFSLFTNPSQLHSISITTNDISVSGVHVGDTVKSVREKLIQSGSWNTTDTQDWWWLDFKEKGLRVGFERDKNQKKYPMSLSKPELATRIEIYDNKINFR